MGREGFEPSKAEPTDLQSAPFDHSGTSPFIVSPKGDDSLLLMILISNLMEKTFFINTFLFKKIKLFDSKSNQSN